MLMPGRTFASGNNYRYSINGQEKTPEIAPNTTTAEFWQYDARIVKRWNVDPKPEVSLSPYSCFAGNPVFYSDVKGDSIPTHFLNQNNNLQGNYQNNIPDKVQQMFNQEYGIQVGYNSKTHMLYYNGDVKTDKKVSQSARKKLIDMLSADYSKKKSERKFGELYFGYSGLQSKAGFDVDLASVDHPIRPLGFLGIGHRGSMFVNLDAFNTDLTVKDFDYSNLTSRGYSDRTFNMARIFEHELFGHMIQRRFDPGNGEFKAGKVEVLPNLFRTEMGLPLRSNYGMSTRKGLVVLFGATHNQVKEAAYDNSKIPMLPYIIKSLVKPN
jgi:hypothetical protein